MTITILGLGHGDPRALTVEAREALESAREIYLRTRQHPTVAALPKRLRKHSFDHLYDTLPGFDEIYSAIADAIIARVSRPVSSALMPRKSTAMSSADIW